MFHQKPSIDENRVLRACQAAAKSVQFQPGIKITAGVFAMFTHIIIWRTSHATARLFGNDFGILIGLPTGWSLRRQGAN